ncbi:AlkA N-terminal domain-containing protein [Ferrimonas sp. SCSIO 43195]|uniref:AlkA N-terminal domain-containing protein n=1 Tax=Ferrimonas sp. SCSIO 43195 TaxID=2822844 RepID=UPI0020762C1C|nr:AlkA N-terminal domain-containing protein [Ferrimonas sp. SCSIO 43195]USD37231.1 helix-turn-helix domain-containing protein [Ferrimonas sp. SCSIO 43195]
MTLTHSQCERARLARDHRFDGRFFTAVKTTGIYCRPVCPAPAPKSDNVEYFANAAAAAKAGYRPCLRCRPESAPFSPAWRGTATTVTRALSLIHAGEPIPALAAFAERLGVSDRHLRRLFEQHLGVSPLAYALNHRLLFAKQLLSESELPILAVAQACGFQSRRRFNDAFQRQFSLTPSDIRRRTDAGGPGCRVQLRFRPPFDWSTLLAFLQTRALPGVERIEADCYSRAFQLGQQRGWFELSPDLELCRLNLTIHCDAPHCLQAVVQRVREVFDLDTDPQALWQAFAEDAQLGPIWRRHPGLRLPGIWSEFEAVVRAIVGQQISVKGARTILSRLCDRFGEPLSQASGLSRTFPTPARLASADLSGLGLTATRARWLQGIARAYADGFEAGHGSLASRLQRLQTLTGVGDWTAQYVCMRGLQESDGFPASDLGLYHALKLEKGSPTQTRELAESWRPWRAYAVMALWQSLGEST